MPLGQADLEEPFHHDLAGQGGGEGGALARRQQGDAEQQTGGCGAQKRAQQAMGLGQIGDGLTGKAMEGAGRQHQNRGVHQKGQGQGYDRVEVGEAECPLANLRSGAPASGLHQGGMEIEVVGHHGGAQDSRREIELGAIAERGRLRHKPAQHAGQVGPQQQHLNGETGADQGHQADHQGFQPADAEALQPQQQQGVEGGEHNAERQGQAEQQLQGQGGSHEFGQITGHDRHLGQEPEGNDPAAG